MNLNVASQINLISLYIGESKLIERLSNETLLIIHRSIKGVNMTRAKELIEFRIRGKLCYFYHANTNKLTEEAKLALALHTQFNGLLIVLGLSDKIEALKFISRICSAYKTSNESTNNANQSGNEIENMEIS